PGRGDGGGEAGHGRGRRGLLRSIKSAQNDRTAEWTAIVLPSRCTVRSGSGGGTQVTRILSALAAIVTAGALSACGGDPESAGPSVSASSPTPSVTAPSTPPATSSATPSSKPRTTVRTRAELTRA